MNADNYSVADYYVFCYYVRYLDFFRGAYLVSRYPEEIDAASDKAIVTGFETDTLEWVLKNWGTNAWFHLICQRYSWSFRRLVDYAVFQLSRQGLLPNLGELHLCREIICSKWENLSQISASEDEEYKEFCKQYKTHLFQAAGWSVSEITYEEILQLKYHRYLFPYFHNSNLYIEESDEFWEDEEDCVYYIFSSEREYTIIEQCCIFIHFSENAVYLIADEHTVIIAVPEISRNSGIELKNDWSGVCPLSATEAWILYMEKNLFHTLRLERRNEI